MVKEEPKKRKCVVLFSGGLDSCLVLKMMAMHGLEVIVFHGTQVFSPATDNRAGQEEMRHKCLEMGASEVIFRDLSDETVAFTKNPQFGHGKHLNACIDCRINTIRNAKMVMKEVGADFLVSGEVLGQRPMSQRKEAMRMVDKQVSELGLDGLLLRPLCAQLLEPTIPEKEGWVNRDNLLDISGRGRNRQIELATELGITDYQTPAGGCLMTDPGFAARLRDLMANQPDWKTEDARLLRVGRHYRLSKSTKVIASRRELENELLQKYATQGEHFYIAAPKLGAIVLIRGEYTEEAARIASGLAVHYSKQRKDGRSHVRTWTKSYGIDEEGTDIGEIESVNPDSLSEYYVGS